MDHRAGDTTLPYIEQGKIATQAEPQKEEKA